MFNIKRVLLIAAMVVSGPLIVPLGAMATFPEPGSSFPGPAGTTGCVMNATGSTEVRVIPEDNGSGVWPIPFTNNTGGTSYEYKYKVTSIYISNAVSKVQIALNAQLPSPVTANASAPVGDSLFRLACKGANNNASNNFALDVCDVRVAGLSQITAGNPGYGSIFMRDISAHAPVGGASVNTGLFTYSCSALSVPIDAPPAFASVQKNDVITANGVDYCIPLGTDGCPLTGTGAGKEPYMCSNQAKTPLQEVTLTISDNVGGGAHTFTWAQGSKDNPACPRGILNGNPGSCYITSGGRTYKIC